MLKVAEEVFWDTSCTTVTIAGQRKSENIGDLNLQHL